MFVRFPISVRERVEKRRKNPNSRKTVKARFFSGFAGPSESLDALYHYLVQGLGCRVEG